MSAPTLFSDLPKGLISPERDFLGLLAKLDRRPTATLVVLFSLTLLINLAFVSVKGWPVPSVHDEFSYLLAADTFSKGRLANPPHPFSAHLETFHVLQEPSYASKYPPLPGAVLALGQCLGHPALGIFLVSAALVAAVYWTLRPVLPHFWSLFGAALAWAQFAPYSFYSCSYMGGGVCALGACLLLGAALRIVLSEKPAPRHSVIMGTAVFILAASRPFEGLLVCFGIGLLLAGRFLSSPSAVKRAWLGSVMAPGAIVLMAAAGILLAYNRAVTGDAFKLPYTAYESTHSRTPLFVWGTLRNNPIPDTPHLRQFEKEFTEKGFLNEKAKGVLQRFGERFEMLLQSFVPFWFPSTILLLLSAFSPNRWTWFSWMVILVFMTACSFTVWFSRHYLGCLLPFLCLLACLGAWQLRSFRWRGKAWGFQIFRIGLWSLFLLQLLLVLAAPAARKRAEAFALRRMEIQENLESLPGPDLVLVTYGADASVHDEWVYNPADIDQSTVVWAHSLGRTEDEKLMRYFSNRRIWRLQVDQKKTEPLVEATARQN